MMYTYSLLLFLIFVEPSHSRSAQQLDLDVSPEQSSQNEHPEAKRGLLNLFQQYQEPIREHYEDYAPVYDFFRSRVLRSVAAKEAGAPLPVGVGSTKLDARKKRQPSDNGQGGPTTGDTANQTKESDDDVDDYSPEDDEDEEDREKRFIFGKKKKGSKKGRRSKSQRKYKGNRGSSTPNRSRSVKPKKPRYRNQEPIQRRPSARMSSAKRRRKPIAPVEETGDYGGYGAQEDYDYAPVPEYGPSDDDYYYAAAGQGPEPAYYG